MNTAIADPSPAATAAAAAPTDADIHPVVATTAAAENHPIASATAAAATTADNAIYNNPLALTSSNMCRHMYVIMP